MAQGYRLHLPNRIADPNNVVGAGWKIYTWDAANPATPIDTYSDTDLSSLNTNPIIADGDGYFRGFVAAGVRVDIEVKDENNVLQFYVAGEQPMVDPATSSPSVTAVPTGGGCLWFTNSAPTGFLICDGSAVLRATYTDLNTLFSAAGYPYGNGDGATTFNLPDLRQRVPLGKAASGTGNTLAATGGAIDHTHTGPSHTHPVVVPRGSWGDVNVNPDTAGMLLVGSGLGLNNYHPTGDQTVTSDAGGTGNTGTANPPYLVINFIIKT